MSSTAVASQTQPLPNSSTLQVKCYPSQKHSFHLTIIDTATKSHDASYLQHPNTPHCLSLLHPHPHTNLSNQLNQHPLPTPTSPSLLIKRTTYLQTVTSLAPEQTHSFSNPQTPPPHSTTSLPSPTHLLSHISVSIIHLFNNSAL